jgi:lantibiotic biosynthesis protein
MIKDSKDLTGLNVMLPTTATLLAQLHRRIQRAVPANNSLMGGRLGRCLYFATLHRHTGRPAAAKAAVAGLEQVLQAAETQPLGYSYASGLAGLAYTMRYLQQAGLAGAGMDAYLRPLDDLLLTNSMAQLRQQQTDFLHGAMGTVHYFISRLPQPAAAAALPQLLPLFCGAAVPRAQGNWFCNNSFGAAASSAEINLSLSHGLCGFLLLLLGAYEKGMALPQIPVVVEKGIALLLHYGQPAAAAPAQHSYFPITLHPHTGAPQYSARLAWCYGDLNVLLLLYKAAALLRRPQWKAMANEWGAAMATRTTAQATLITSSHFCHGSSGLVQVYRCLHRHSGQRCYHTAAGYWLRQTLHYLPAELAAGHYRGKEGDLLEGLVGVALVLMDAQAGQPGGWAQALLVG